MPKFNRQGPKGKGPMSGRSMGKCGNKTNRILGQENTMTPTENNLEQMDTRPMFMNRGRGKQRCQSNGGGFGGGRKRGRQINN